jgi:hypothetical protein
MKDFTNCGRVYRDRYDRQTKVVKGHPVGVRDEMRKGSMRQEIRSAIVIWVMHRMVMEECLSLLLRYVRMT